jgi:predicted nucleotidyltransferase
MKYGLSPIVIKQITDVINQFPQVEETIIYGSRAKGNYKPSSDVDITLKGNNLTLQHLNRVALMLDDLLLPQKFDVSIYQHISNPDLLDHIARVGQLL